MGKRKTYIPKSFESAKPYAKSGDTYAAIYRSMRLSNAWQDLSPKQHDLYFCCKSEYYGKGRHDLDQFNNYFTDNGIEKNSHPEYFTMNWGKVKRPDGLYALYTNSNSFYSDMASLIDHGFIDCVICGADARAKSLYKLSDRWQRYGTEQYEVPEEVKTIALRGTRKWK